MQIRPRSTAENTSALELEAQQPHAPHDPSHPASSSSSRSRPASPSDLTDQTHHLPPLKAVLAFVALGLTTLLAVLDSSIVANAVSRMTDDLGQGDKSAWIGSVSLQTFWRWRAGHRAHSQTCLHQARPTSSPCLASAVCRADWATSSVG